MAFSIWSTTPFSSFSFLLLTVHVVRVEQVKELYPLVPSPWSSALYPCQTLYLQLQVVINYIILLACRAEMNPR